MDNSTIANVNSQWPYIVRINIDSLMSRYEAYEWACEFIEYDTETNDSWFLAVDSSAFYFKYEKDAVLFALKFS
jgi:hypothetical protein